MGRYKTGARTLDESFRICISYLKKRKILHKGCIYVGEMTWSRHGRQIGVINIIGDYRSSADIFIRLNYVLTNSRGQTEYDYKIRVVEAPTNLGRGVQLYFICPESGYRCRQLYRAYGSGTWKSRKAYSYRLYYNLQIVSKLWRTTERYFNVEEQLEKDAKKRKALDYGGKKTKRFKLMEQKEQKLYLLDLMRWQFNSMPVNIQKLIKR